MAKEAFNSILLFLTCKLNIELRKRLVRCYVLRIELYGSETLTLRNLMSKYFGELGSAMLDDNGEDYMVSESS